MRAAGRVFDEGVIGAPDRSEALSWYCTAADGDLPITALGGTEE
jgi:hypothetical protein